MSIAAANLFTRNVYREFFHARATDRQEAQMAKWVSLIVKFGARVEPYQHGRHGFAWRGRRAAPRQGIKKTKVGERESALEGSAEPISGAAGVRSGVLFLTSRTL
jgi:hypothetical protein